VRWPRDRASAGQESHPVVRGGQSRPRDGAGLLSTTGQRTVQLGRVVEEAAHPALERHHEVQDGGGDLLLQVAVACAGEPVDQGRHRLPAERGQDPQQVAHARLRDRVEHDLAAGVGDRRADLLLDHLRVVHQPHDPVAADALGHLLVHDLQVVDLRGLAQDVGLGHPEGVAEAVVEPLRQVAGELDVLALVLADRHLVGLVEQDVGRLQDRVGEQAHRRVVAATAGGLVLELRHPARLAEAGDAAEHPGELGVLRHVGLDEQRRPVQVHPGGEILGGRDPGALPQLGRVVLHRDRVQVDHAVERLVAVLQGDPLPQRTQVVAEVQRPGGRLHAGQDSGPGLVGHDAHSARGTPVRNPTVPRPRLSWSRAPGRRPARAAPG
jgi:hypothetical protein